jgi:hypothetical protein
MIFEFHFRNVLAVYAAIMLLETDLYVLKGTL